MRTSHENYGQYSTYVRMYVCTYYLWYTCVYLQVSVELAQFHAYIKDTVRTACEDALVEEGFVPDPLDSDEEGTYVNTDVRMYVEYTYCINTC